MREDARATHQLRYGPFRGEDSASAASLYQCYAGKLAAA